ncbi:hypothetical protein F2Q69_00027494 [Brassica cretica]|uniref:Uncharacterized protein n=1 Tax=Brassica cretica TaxID=69181 RepID=A0A8S9RS81_BRACR|nr:hypothetical protein F2Q69_00027494 [Brassica cretica]
MRVGIGPPFCKPAKLRASRDGFKAGRIKSGTGRKRDGSKAGVGVPHGVLGDIWMHLELKGGEIGDHWTSRGWEREETISARRNLEGDDQRSSKMWLPPSRSLHCGGGKAFKNMATTYRTNHGHLPGGYLSSLCQPCSSYFSNCYHFTCTTTVYCQSINGSPPMCTRYENCNPTTGN